jgi:hypothetical protein
VASKEVILEVKLFVSVTFRRASVSSQALSVWEVGDEEMGGDFGGGTLGIWFFQGTSLDSTRAHSAFQC